VRVQLYIAFKNTIVKTVALKKLLDRVESFGASNWMAKKMCTTQINTLQLFQGLQGLAFAPINKFTFECSNIPPSITPNNAGSLFA